MIPGAADSRPTVGLQFTNPVVQATKSLVNLKEVNVQYALVPCI